MHAAPSRYYHMRRALPVTALCTCQHKYMSIHASYNNPSRVLCNAVLRRVPRGHAATPLLIVRGRVGLVYRGTPGVAMHHQSIVQLQNIGRACAEVDSNFRLPSITIENADIPFMHAHSLGWWLPSLLFRYQELVLRNTSAGRLSARVLVPDWHTAFALLSLSHPDATNELYASIITGRPVIRCIGARFTDAQEELTSTDQEYNTLLDARIAATQQEWVNEGLHFGGQIAVSLDTAP